MKCLVIIIFGIFLFKGVMPRESATSSLLDGTVHYNLSCQNNITSNNSSGRYVVVKTDRFLTSNNSILIDELGRVKCSKDMKEFLQNHIFWHVRIYKLTNSTDIVSSNNTRNFNHLFFSRSCHSCFEPDNDADENDDDNFIKEYYILVVVLGLVSLLGNIFTIAHEMNALNKNRLTNSKERRVYNILVLNLCFANFLMGIYLVTCPVILRILERVSLNLCNAMGVISTLSVQASASILTIITAYRLYGIMYPYKPVHTKLTVALLVFVWLTWFIVASLPLLDELLFEYEFTREIEVQSSGGEANFSPLGVSRTVQSFSQASNITDEPFSRVLHALSEFDSNEVFVQVLQSFGLVDFDRDEVRFVGFYSQRRWCTVEIFVDAKNSTLTYFSLFLLIVNFVEFLFILIAYIIIFMNISTLRINKFFPCLPQKSFVANQGQKMQRTQNRKSEDRKIYLRIFLVVITDLICGIAICLIGLVHYLAGYEFDCFRNHSFTQFATPVVAILIPLNSIVNPYIYSFHLWKDYLKCCKQRLLKCFSS